jgi:hypothetical protein
MRTTDRHYIFTDGILGCGLAKPLERLPMYDKAWPMSAPDYILIRRDTLRDALRSVSCIIAQDRELLVRLTVEGSGLNAKLTLSTQSPTNRGLTSLTAFREYHQGQEGAGENKQCQLSLADLLKNICHFTSQNVHLQILDKLIILTDEGEGFIAKTFLFFKKEVASDRLRH